MEKIIWQIPNLRTPEESKKNKFIYLIKKLINKSTQHARNNSKQTCQS